MGEGRQDSELKNERANSRIYPYLDRLFSVFKNQVNSYIQKLWNEESFRLQMMLSPSQCFSKQKLKLNCMEAVILAESSFGRHHKKEGFRVISIGGNSILKLKRGKVLLDFNKINKIKESVRGSAVIIGTDADFMGQVLAEYLRKSFSDNKVLRMALTNRGYLAMDFHGDWVVEKYQKKVDYSFKFFQRFGIKAAEGLFLAEVKKHMDGKGRVFVKVKNPYGANTVTAMCKLVREGVSPKEFLNRLYYKGIIAYPRVETDYASVPSEYIAHPSFFEDIDLSLARDEEKELIQRVLTPINLEGFYAEYPEDLLLLAYNGGYLTAGMVWNLADKVRDLVEINQGKVKFKEREELIDEIIRYAQEHLPPWKEREEDKVIKAKEIRLEVKSFEELERLWEGVMRPQKAEGKEEKQESRLVPSPAGG